MKVQYLEGRNAGKVVEMPYHIAAPLIATGRVRDIRQPEPATVSESISPASTVAKVAATQPITQHQGEAARSKNRKK